MSDFWISSGHHLTDHSPDGGFVVTDDFLRLYLARPEILPPDDACPAERVLHARVMAEPRLAVDPAWVDDITDPDARENWRLFLDFRDRLLAHPTLEAVYNEIAANGAGGTPPLFLQQLVHVILRNVLDEEPDAEVLRAGEIFFRPQRVSTKDGRLLLADEEQVGDERPNAHGSPLTAMFEDAASRALDVLGPETAAGYRARSDAHDLVLDFRLGGSGREALARVMERWLAHMLGLRTTIEPVARVDGEMRWFVGLDAEATRIGNAAWRSGSVAPEDADRIVALYQLEIRDRDRVREDLAGDKVTLILAMDARGTIRFKPQNLLAGLPLKPPAA